MVETKMPAAEAEVAAELENESFAYELSFHVLPTVAEGEVPAVFDKVKTAITKAGGEIFDEEVPERFDLAYEIVKYLEGKNRKFQSAYFGWVRFKCESNKIANLVAEMDADNNILRHLLLRLTRVEEENPFRFHEALRDQKMVTSVEESEVIPDFSTVKEGDEEENDSKKEEGEVDEKELDKALEEKEV